VEIESYVKNNFNFTIQNIIDELELKTPIFKKTASFGHFGRNEFPWERIKN
jgi:S-adenosylmethionine synthetase